MPDGDSSGNAAPKGFDAQKALRDAGPQSAPRDPGDLTMGVSNKDFERRDRWQRAGGGARTNENTVDSSAYIEARILWPALGFPEIISPQGGDGRDPTSCVNLLILSEAENLYPADVARHLRWVPWEERHTRWLPSAEKGGTNAFRAAEISVYDPAVEKSSGLIRPVLFADDHGAHNGIMVGISTFVLDFYAAGYKGADGKEHKLRYLHHVKISRDASAKLPAGKLLNLFWVNRNPKDTRQQRSAEMHPLIEKFAKSSRFGNDGVPTWDALVNRGNAAEYAKGLLEEYEYDYKHDRTPENRTEVLHPLLVRDAPPKLRVGHLTDLHFDIRHNTYEANLRRSGMTIRGYKDFNNWNRTSRTLYERARKTCDILLMTGDLIEFGRGHNEAKLEDGSYFHGSDTVYWRDRNWFLFYEVLANGTNYHAPVYTNLGNHDWRLNPYPAEAPGSPDPKEMNLAGKEQFRIAHGPGYDIPLMYSEGGGGQAVTALRQKFGKEGSFEARGTPLETCVESVAWYLMLINPFLDYSFPLPGGYDVLMLDWAEDELVDFPKYKAGVDDGTTMILPNTYGGPRPKNSLSDQQITLFRHFAAAKGQASILGIHAPVVGPWSFWDDENLRKGLVRLPENRKLPAGVQVEEQKLDPRGNPAGKPTRYTEHAALAFRHAKYDPYAQVADYGAVALHREWLVDALRRSGTDLVLSGHIHRRNVLVIEKLPDGAQVVKCVPESAIATAPKPLFVNTTSAGPRGHDKHKFGVHERCDSAYAEIEITNAGNVLSIQHVDVVAAGQPLPPSANKPGTAPTPAPPAKPPIPLTF